MSSRGFHASPRFVGAAAALIATTFAALLPGQQPQTKPPSAAASESQADDAFAEATEPVVERVCVQCHTVENFTKRSRTAKEWNDVVNAM